MRFSFAVLSVAFLQYSMMLFQVPTGFLSPCTWCAPIAQNEGSSIKATDSAGGPNAISVHALNLGLDKYGGVLAAPCPGGVKRFFYTQKLGAQWRLCTPAGHAFWLNGVYNVQATDDTPDYRGVVLTAVIRSKYATGTASDATLNWALQSVRRMKSWGFNTISEYSHAAMLPTTTDFGWNGITPDRTLPEKLPFTIIIRPSWYSFRNVNGYARSYVKDLVAGIKRDVYPGYRTQAADFWDPSYREWFRGALLRDAGIRQTFTGPNNDYLIGFVVDESDNMYGFGPGPDFPTTANGVVDKNYDQPNLGWIALVTAPNQNGSSDFGVTYSDSTVYTKQEFVRWLAARYSGNVGALNEGWQSSYTTFGSAGTFGSGMGLLDEDGKCPARLSRACWVPSDWRRLSGATTAMKRDLDDFVLHHARRHFSTIRSVLETETPGRLYLGPLLGGWGTPPRREILQAASEYVDVLQVVQTPPNCTDCKDVQHRIDFIARYGGDKPWLEWEGFQAKADSYMSEYANKGQRDQLQTQVDRGALYRKRVADYVAAKDWTGTSHVVGIQWWEFYDNRAENANWGLVTRLDDPYDGASASPEPAADSWGYSTGCVSGFGCEKRSYGDFLTAVRAANFEAVRAVSATGSSAK